MVSGLFGVGGGILLVPVLVLVMRVEQRVAHGTSLAAMIPIACAGAIGFWSEGRIDWTMTAELAAGAIPGALTGAWLLHRLHGAWLSRSFAVLLLVSAGRLVFGDAADPTAARSAGFGLAAVLVVIGFGSGALAGMLGVGGGALMIPAMVILVHISNPVARGTSLLVIVPTAVAGTVANVRRRNARLDLAAVVGVAGSASAYLASRLSVGLGERMSNLLFAALLVVVAMRMVMASRPVAARASVRS